MQKSYFFNSICGDRKYSAEDFCTILKTLVGDGIMPNPANCLEVMYNDGKVKINTGKAFIRGHMYENIDIEEFEIEEADNKLDRIDRVVLRLDKNLRKVYLDIKKGEYNLEPIPSELTRTEMVYELALADIYVSHISEIAEDDIIDRRLNIDYCGICHMNVLSESI